MNSCVQIILLLLQGSGQVLNIFFLLLKVHVHLLCLGSEPRILTLSDVILDLEVPIHVTHVLFLSGFEYGCLVGFQYVLM